MANKVEQVRKEAEEKLSEFFNIVSDKVDDKKSKMNTQKEETSSVKCQTLEDFECKNVKCENKIERKEPEIAAYCSEKCYELFPENFEYAQKLYEIYRLYRNREWKKEAKLAEKCLDLANNEQKIKYSRYYYESIAEYYRNETSDYEKAVENYKKAVKASEETGKD